MDVTFEFFQFYKSNSSKNEITKVLYTDALDTGIFLTFNQKSGGETKIIPDYDPIILRITKGDGDVVERELSINDGFIVDSRIDIYEKTNFEEGFGKSGNVSVVLCDADGNEISYKALLTS